MAPTRVYANVGQRDLALGGEALTTPKDQPKTRLRERSREIAAAYEARRAELTAPILEPALREIARRDGAPLEELILTVTDQPEGVPHRAGDTLHTGEILARLLPELGLVRSVRLWTVARSPNSHEAMLAEIEPRLAAEPPPGDGERRYVLISGGTPAANLALLYGASVAWGEACVALATGEDGSVAEFPLARRILERDRREKAREMARVWELAAIRHLYPEADDCEPGLLARLAHAREHLAIGRARELADRLARGFPERAETYRAMEAELAALAGPVGAAHVAEAWWQAELFWRRGELNELLARLYLLDDQVRLWALRRWLGCESDPDPAALGKAIPRESSLAGQLTADELDQLARRPKVVSGGLARSLIGVVERGDALPGASDPAPSALVELMRRLGPLREFRNNVVSGHRFGEATPEAILKSCRELKLWKKERPTTLTDIVDSLRQTLAVLGLPVASRPSPWEKVHTLFMEMLSPTFEDGRELAENVVDPRL